MHILQILDSGTEGNTNDYRSLFLFRIDNKEVRKREKKTTNYSYKSNSIQSNKPFKKIWMVHHISNNTSVYTYNDNNTVPGSNRSGRCFIAAYVINPPNECATICTFVFGFGNSLSM